ncbi:postacrosomal sheath WW domain-binding protein [Otolemur garnettii]|uniref:postacrosomal sheath WW domain-binding protein n=1 Tax=Otolemur garnettii TaxID=30611 RepID=UPI000273FA30|nr:postacrosomal sheath WW domain-binding protein [Otolemur garnettii]
MAVNQSHTANRRGAIIPAGESLLMQITEVELSFPHQPRNTNLFSGTKRGTLFLTSYRVIFLTVPSINDPMLSFMMPFDLMTNCTVEQPVFGANYIKGTIQSAPQGGWEGQAIFKLIFRRGGAIEFAQLMMRAASAAAQGTPLRTLNDLFGRVHIYVINGQGTMCVPEAPCSGTYTAPPAGSGFPPPGQQAPPPGYGVTPAGYGIPPPGQEAPPPGYAVPPEGYGAPPPGNVCGTSAGYGAPPPGREAPPPGYSAPPPGYGASPRGYGAPPAGYGAPPPQYGTPPEGYGAPPPQYGTPPEGYGAPRVETEGTPPAS